MLHCPHCGLLDAPDPDGACTRCGRRPDEPTPPAPPSRPAAPDPAAIALHPMDVTKLVVMSTATFGLYNLFWFYRNWTLRNVHRRREVWPLARAFFSALFAYSLFDDVAWEVARVGREPAWHPGWMGLLYFILHALWRLPDPYWFLCFGAVIPLAVVQASINGANRACPAPLPVNDGYSALNLVGILLGGVLGVLSVIGTLFA
jgi:hypothetical protein